jgi:serine/threonine protein kinase
VSLFILLSRLQHVSYIKEELNYITAAGGEFMVSNIDDLVGKTLGTYTFERLLGHGGMGVVYLAQQTRPARRVAVKIVSPQFAPNSQVYQEFLVRFRREADVIARLEHVNIMPIYECGEQDGLTYLVMPYLTGGSLRDMLASRGALPLSRVITYIDQAAAALDYAHSQGVIHRDLKPANFLLHADGRLVLADFGIARILDTHASPLQTLTATGSMLGTPEYMAPEMARGEAIDYRADIYELGIVLFQLLNGRAPFTGNTPYAIAIKHIQEPLPLLRLTNPSIPSTVDAVIQKATAKQREDRYTSATALAHALRQAGATPLIEQEEDQQYTIPPTVVSSPLVNRPDQTLQAHPAPIQPPLMPSSPNDGFRGGSTPAYTHTTQNDPAYQPLVPNTPYPVSSRQRPPWWVFISILLVLVLFVGGILIGLQINRSPLNTKPSSTPTSSAVQQTPKGTGATTSTTATIPTGAQLYSASSPGQYCDTHSGAWTDYNGVKIDCLDNKAIISSTAQTGTLQGTFLTQIPGQTYPSNYVVQVQLQQEQTSRNEFGIYFRNQPGQQQGVYTFLISPAGTWSAYVYDNTSGKATKLTGGNLGNISVPMTLAVIVNGQQFTFYANGNMLGQTSDTSYSSGTAGIAVDQGANVIASNFVLYATAS